MDIWPRLRLWGQLHKTHVTWLDLAWAVWCDLLLISCEINHSLVMFKARPRPVQHILLCWPRQGYGRSEQSPIPLLSSSFTVAFSTLTPKGSVASESFLKNVTDSCELYSCLLWCYTSSKIKMYCFMIFFLRNYCNATLSQGKPLQNTHTHT